MTLQDVLLLVLRGFGALYLVGGVWMARQMWFWARMSPDMDRLVQVLNNYSHEEQSAHDPDEDHGRSWWLFAGAVITAICGAAMLLAYRGAPFLLSLLIAHQLLYFIRQRRRELRAPTPEEARQARPNQQTVNGFFATLIMAVLAAWLARDGALWP